MTAFEGLVTLKSPPNINLQPISIHQSLHHTNYFLKITVMLITTIIKKQKKSSHYHSWGQRGLSGHIRDSVSFLYFFVFRWGGKRLHHFEANLFKKR